jgi:hypothetical protein
VKSKRPAPVTLAQLRKAAPKGWIVWEWKIGNPIRAFGVQIQEKPHRNADLAGWIVVAHPCRPLARRAAFAALRELAKGEEGR